MLEEKERKEKEEKIKSEKLLVAYKYWDGYGHKYEMTVTKGTSIFKFLIYASKVFSNIIIAISTKISCIKRYKSSRYDVCKRRFNNTTSI